MIQMHEQKGGGEEEKEGESGHQFKPDPFRSTISSLNEHEVLAYIQSSLKKQQQMDEIEEKGEEGEEEEEEGEVLDIRTAKPFMISRLGEERELPVFYEGSCVGNGLLNHYASDQNPDNKPPTDVKWPISPSGSEQPENTQEMAEAITIVRSVTSPVNIVAASKGTTVSKLPFHVLENILSDISILTYLDNPTNEEPDEIEGPRRRAESMRNPHMLADDSSRKRQACRGFITFLQQQGIPMNLQQFNNMGCIGKGSFGTVIWMKPKKALMDDYVRLKYTEADMKEEEREEKMSKDAILKKSSVAVKMISKQSAANSDQFSHVMNEKNILIEMSHPFILDIFGTFQDPDTLYFVTEVLPGGDLWSVMYECKILKNRREVGLPRLAVKFYIGCLVLALVHVHGKGVAFRDLKPENVMVDSEGYVRLIDFGFAKKVPWTEIKDGKEVIQPKTFTLCGTPEYLAPEFIFNSGHDHSVDLWSLGVVMFEMIMGFTPFISKKPNDMTGLFTNIALTKKKGVRFPSKFQSKSGDPNAKSFITELLKADYATRLGNGPRGSQELKEHPYFDEMDFARLLNKQYNPPWVPLQENPEVSLGESLNTEKFTGDDSQFADF
jgi:serine/threonine protein kinase